MDLAPLRERTNLGLAKFQDEMNRLFSRFFDDWVPEALGRSQWLPALDIAERDDAVVVKADLPGIKPEEIEITVEDNVLTISGEKKESTETQEENYYHCERRHGRFRRDIPLPRSVDPEKIDASCQDGVLTVTLPKRQEAKPKRITVKC